MLTVDMNAGRLAQAWRTNTVGALYEMAKRFPGEKLDLRIGDASMLVLQDAESVRHVLKGRPGNYLKNFGSLQDFFGASRFTTDGKLWEELQQLSQPSISSARPDRVVSSTVTAFTEACERMLRSDTASVAVDQLLNRSAAQVISEVAFGIPDLNVDTLVDSFRDILRFGVIRTWNMGGSNIVPSQQARDSYEAAKGQLVAEIEAIIGLTDRVGGSELVQRIRGGASTGVDVIAEISSLLFAGFDTTAAAVGWGMFLLAASPDLQHDLRRQVRAVAGDGPITTGTLDALPDLWAFQQEVLRIFPSVPLIGRTALADDEIGDVQVRQGQPVVVSLVGLHHDPRYFPSPAYVRLGRYKDGRAGKDIQGHHLPFSSGRRACAGSAIANVELGTAFAVIVSQLELALPDRAPLQFEWTGSLRRRGGHSFVVTPA